MTKGQRTRARIVERAAVLFNTRGVAGASMADVSAATGLEKGGVYNHFATKEDLAGEAFDYASRVVFERIEHALGSERDPVRRLEAFLDVYRRAQDRPLLKGGCPLLNTAVEADDTDPALRRRVRAAFDTWRARLAEVIAEAVRCRRIVTVDPQALATTFVATIEGGVMLAKVYGDPAHLVAAVDHLSAHLRSLERAA